MFSLEEERFRVYPWPKRDRLNEAGFSFRRQFFSVFTPSREKTAEGLIVLNTGPLPMPRSLQIFEGKISGRFVYDPEIVQAVLMEVPRKQKPRILEELVLHSGARVLPTARNQILYYYSNNNQ